MNNVCAGVILDVSNGKNELILYQYTVIHHKVQDFYKKFTLMNNCLRSDDKSFSIISVHDS